MDITVLRYLSNNDIQLSFICQIRILHILFKKIRYPDHISDFHIFQSDSDISVFDICHLLIN